MVIRAPNSNTNDVNIFRIGQGGSGIPIYPNINQNLCKISKFEKNYTDFIPKSKKSAILYTQFLALKYRISNIKYSEIPYTQKPWPTLYIANDETLSLRFMPRVKKKNWPALRACSYCCLIFVRSIKLSVY